MEATLAAAPEAPTLLALHHAPIAVGIPAFDEVGLPPAERRAFATVVEGHPQVRRIVAGHTHRTISAELGGEASSPSGYVRSALLDFGAKEIEVSRDPPGFADSRPHAEDWTFRFLTAALADASSPSGIAD